MSARFNHSVAVKSDGTVWTWGNNSNGQIGDGSTTQRNSPVQVAGVSAAVSVTAGYFHTLSLSSDGSVKAWGSSLYGQIGDGATTQRTTPVTIAGVSDIVEIKAGYAHSVALKADGTVWAWGLNNKGQIGDGTTTQRNSPVQISGISGVISIAAGFYHTLALKSDGTVWAWGENNAGQIGDGTTIQRNSPVRVGTLDAVVSLSAGFGFSLALKTDGTVRAWGNNTYGQLGDGTTTQRNSPITVSSMGNVVTVAAAFGSSMFLKADGKVWGCGMNSNSQLGDGTSIQRTTPVLVSGGLVGVASLALGNSHSLAVKADGTVWAWGFNVNGQLGRGNTTQISTPAQTLIVTGISAAQISRTQGTGRNGHGISLSAGELHSLSLNSKGEVWAWGSNTRGQIGNGTTEFKPLPIKLPGISGVTVLAAGREHSLALKSDGKVWAWGANDQGQLGDGTTIDKSAPTLVPGLSQIVAIAAGSSHSLALKADGTLWVWGGNVKGQLGLGNTINRLSPVALTGLTGVISLGAGATHTLALRHDGTVWTWGGNDEGRLGDGSIIQRNTPVQVTGLSSVVSVAGGDCHSVALKTDGTLWTWGANTRGQLGNGGTVSSLTPVQIPLLNGMVAIAAGRNHGAALSWNGTVRVWGANECAQAGVGSMFDQKTPVQIPDLPVVIALAAACDHNLTLAMDGGIVGWGRNSCSQLGDKSVIERAAPIKVINASDVVSLSAGINHTLARKSDKTLLTWGYNDFGQLGTGTDGLRSIPAPIPDLGDVLSQAGGATHTLIAKTDGTVWACGGNATGQLGDGTTTPRTSLTQLANLSSIARVAAGTGHSLALALDGSVWTWGANAVGQLGNGSTLQQTVPAKIPNLTDVSQIACGTSHSLILKSNGTVWAWGQNTDGRLGDGSTVQRNSPVQVLGLNNIVAIAAGGSHSLALKQDNTVWIWGGNSHGQLGNGTTAPSFTPIQIQGLSDVVSIAAGSNHTAVLLLDGSLMSWGANDSGQLGNGTKLPQLTPVLLDGKYGPESTLSAGGDKTYVIKEDGTLFAWGLGAYGELANAFAEFRHKGVSVLGFNRVHPVPSLQVSSPPSPSELATGSNVAIELNATVTNGQIAKAFFYADGILLKQDDTAPFSFDYSPDTWGNVDINAVVVSSAGAMSAPAGLFLETPYDFDQDGISDWSEILSNSNLTDQDAWTSNSQDASIRSVNGPDIDEDGMDDPWEEANGMDPNDKSDGSLDFDRDGYTNLAEYGNETDPRSAPNFRLRELGPFTDLSEAQLVYARLGDGVSNPTTGITESVYFMGKTPLSNDTGRRPVAWSVAHGSQEGITIPFPNHGSSPISPIHTEICAQASGGAALSFKYASGASTQFYYWRSPGVDPIPLSGEDTQNNIRYFYGGSSLSPMGNYLVGSRQRESGPSISQPVLWKMPLAPETTFQPVPLTLPPGVALPYSPCFYVNDYGFVAATGVSLGKKVAILWKINATGNAVSVSILPHPSEGNFASSSVTGISNELDPLIVGRSMMSNVAETAAAWRQTGALVSFNIPSNFSFSAAAAVSPNGRVAGICRLRQDGPGEYRIFTLTRNPTTSTWRFQVHGEIVLGAEIQSINNDGEIFGSATTAFGQAWTKFLWRHGKGHALDRVIPAHTGHLQSGVSALNSQGTLMATTFKDGATMTVILTPDPDTDDDGLPDNWENEHQLNPLAKNAPGFDSDSDGLTDLEEFYYGTNPTNPDSDNDGMKDGWEVSWGFLPGDESDAALDPDNDRVTNLRESQIGTTPTGIYQVSQRYADAASLGPIIHSDDFGNLVFTGPWNTDYRTEPNNLNIVEMGYQRFLLPAQGNDVLPVLRDGEFEFMDYWLRMWEQDSYGTNPLTGEVFGWLTRSNWYDPIPDAPYFVPSGGTFLIPDVANNVEDPLTWNSWANLESSLRDPNQHNGNAPLGPNETLTISWPDAISSSGARRIIRSSAGESFVINETGGFEEKLPGLAQWEAVNDLGLAIRAETRTIPTTGDSPAITIAEMFVSNGNSFELDLAPEASPFVTIISLSDDGKALISTSVLNSQLASTIQYFLVDTTTGSLARVRTPGLGYESIAKLSTTQARLLGNGNKPFHVTPDGTCIRLEALRIKNQPLDNPEPLSTLYSEAITPIHITPEGTITVFATNSQNQNDILKMIPHNDSDNDGMPDDWETSEIQLLVASDPVRWAALLATGTLDTNISYWDDRWTAAQSYALGLSGSNRLLSTTRDSDGDLVNDSEDADPLDPVVDWRRSPEPRWALKEIGSITAVSDVSENGTVLQHVGWPEYDILVDRNFASYTVPAFDFSPVGGHFYASVANTLIGDRMYGLKISDDGQVQHDTLWDPLPPAGSAEFTPYPLDWYPDAILDSPGEFQVRRNYSWPHDNLKTPFGVLVGSEGARWSRIEENGNVVAQIELNNAAGGYTEHVSYWNLSPTSNNYGTPRTIPIREEFWYKTTQVVSTTINQPKSSIDPLDLYAKWHLVASGAGVHVARDDAGFVHSAIGEGLSASFVGIGTLGWVAADTNQSDSTMLWCNGKWKDFRDLVGLVGVNRPESIRIVKIRDNGVGVALVKYSGEEPKFMLMAQIAVLEMSPKLRDEQDQTIYGSEILKPLPTANEMVERNPDSATNAINDASTRRIAWRDLKVKVGKIFKGKKATWSMTAQFTPWEEFWPGPPYASTFRNVRPVATGPQFRGDWAHAATVAHRHRFSASDAYSGHPVTQAGNEASTIIDDSGYTAIRVNVPPIGFNKARITLEIEVTPTHKVKVDLLDLEVPAVVVIDPGHGTGGFTGNSAEGSVGLHTNVTEGDAVLDIGTRALNEIKRIKDERGLLVRKYSTKNSNEPRLNIGLSDREGKARQYGADTYVSLHFDGATTDPNDKRALYRNPFGMIDQDDTMWNRNPRADWALARRVRMAVQTAIAAVEPAESIQASETAYNEWNATHDPDAERLTSEINESRLQIGLGALNDGGNPGQENGNYRVGDVRYTPCRATLIEIERTANKQADNLFNGNTAYNAITGEITLTALAESMRARVATEIAGACINDVLIRDLADQADVPVRTSRVPRLDFENE